MKLNSVLTGVNCEIVSGNPDIEITNIDYDSRKIAKNGLFVAIKWTHIDGNEYIENAINNGATAIITDQQINKPTKNITVVRVDDSYKNLFKLASNFYENPTEKLNIIGITGTNGKTTTTYLLKSIFEKRDKVAIIGTIKYIIGDEIKPAPNTTPDALVLNRLFSEIVNKGIKTVIMEVSSHALALERTRGIKFDTVAFTNLSREHLDFHKNMENYFAAKTKLFKNYESRKKIINIDDKYGESLYKSISNSVYSYSLKEKADFSAGNITIGKNGIKFNMKLKDAVIDINSGLLGEYNIYNILLASSIAYLNDFTSDEIKSGIEKVKTVEGRTELIKDKVSGIDSIVDYAHTPDALERLLIFAREGKFWKRIILVFGCGGDRDVEKRSKMGEIACKYADEIIITNDNPRDESPAKIVKDIENGMKCEHIVEMDRSIAIEKALSIARRGDLVIIAGKGHEDYQIIGKQKKHFSDREELLKRLK